MGLVPRGPGPHDIAASLKIPQNASEALQIAATGGCHPVDLGILNKNKVAGLPPLQRCAPPRRTFDYSMHTSQGLGAAHCMPRDTLSILGHQFSILGLVPDTNELAPCSCPQQHPFSQRLSQVFMNLVNTGLAAELDQGSPGAHAACLVSLLHPDRDTSGQGMPAKQKEQHGCLSFLSVGTTIFQGVSPMSSCNL